MALCVIAGGAGIYFHLLGSMEFKLESRPTLAGMELFWEALRSKAPPLLAPGSMIQLGLLGLVYTYKHPARQRAER
jgi:drug/metabolite transporter superfamily protein YnfA